MKKLKLIPSLLTAALPLSLLAGCGSETTSTPAPSEAAKATAAATTAAAATAAPSALEGKVVFWSMWKDSEPQAKVIQTTVDEFKAANPKVNVDLKFTGRDLGKLIKPALDGGQQVDIYEGDPAGLIATLKDHVFKFDDLLTQPAVGMAGKSFKDSLLPSLMDWTKSLSKTAGIAEGYYAIPQQPYAVLFFYNKAVYDKAGVTSAPKTWDEFMAACELIKKSGVAPITFDDAYRDQFIGGYLSSAMGSDWVDQLVKDKTGEMWKDPIIAQFAKDVVTMKDKGYFSATIAGSKYPAAQQDLVLGKSATYLNGTWLPNEVSATSGPDFKWGSFQFPTIANGNGKGGQQGLSFGAQALLMNKNSKNVPAAFELVKYLAGKKAQEGMATQALAIPATIDSKWPAQLNDASVAFANAKVNMPWGFGIDNAGDFSANTIIPVFMELVTGKIKADEYVTKMSAEAKKFYAGK